jgi:hypothetical protein
MGSNRHQDLEPTPETAHKTTLWRLGGCSSPNYYNQQNTITGAGLDRRRANSAVLLWATADIIFVNGTIAFASWSGISTLVLVYGVPESLLSALPLFLFSTCPALRVLDAFESLSFSPSPVFALIGRTIGLSFVVILSLPGLSIPSLTQAHPIRKFHRQEV